MNESLFCSVFSYNDSVLNENKSIKHAVDPLMVQPKTLYRKLQHPSCSTLEITNKPGRPKNSNSKLFFQPISKVAAALILERKQKEKIKVEEKIQTQTEKINYESDESQEHIIITNESEETLPILCEDKCDNETYSLDDGGEINTEITESPSKKSNREDPAVAEQQITVKNSSKTTCKDCIICDKCGYVSKTSSGLFKHLQSHLGELPYVCSFKGCDYRAQRYSNLYYHKKKVHASEEKIKCDIRGCDYITRYQPSLRIHYIKKHNGDKTIACDLCSYRCYLRGELRKHMITHSTATPYACDFPGCAYSCKLSTNLRKHRRSHTEERPYSCEQCPFRSNFISSLKAHRRTHTDERPYCCHQCGHTCNSASNLKKHIRHRHDKHIEESQTR